MVSITIENVTKLFGDTKAVDGVSLKIEKGELFFLLGPSGCGKTTLLRMIAGFYIPDGGRILFDDRDVSHVPPHRRNTGMVFQNYALWPHMTVRENLAFGLEMRKVSEKDRAGRVDRALELVQMTEYADRSPNQLSGGQQQRVALGRALVLEPDVILLDEPLSNLDAKLRLEMRERIKRIHDDLGITMVYVTHDQAEALSMADRMTIMRRGLVGQLGEPRDIYHRPNSRFIADFIGETNLIDGRLRRTESGFAVHTEVGDFAAGSVPESLSDGDEVTCSIRPEHMELVASAGEAGNQATGVVSQVFFLGNYEQYFVRLSDGTLVKVVESDARRRKAAVGEAVTVGCAAEDVVVLRRE